MFCRITVKQNSVDPDQMLRSVASDLVFNVYQCPFHETLGLNGLAME